MKAIINNIQKWQITRTKLEIISVLVIIVCGLSVFTLTISSKASLTYDNGQIKYTGYVLNHRMNGKGKLVTLMAIPMLGILIKVSLMEKERLQLVQGGLTADNLKKVRLMARVL